jgi:AraC family transcriptional regulator of adaptative response / DNA-3-methyladenine glycosylase II
LTGWIGVEPSSRRNALRLTVSASLARVVPAVLARVRHAFDLGCDPAPIAERLGELAMLRPGLRVPGTCDGFELAVRAVIGQQISVAGARTLAERVDGDFPAGLTHCFPSADALATRTVADLRAIGITAARTRTLLDLAAAVAAGVLRLEVGADVDATRRALESIRGIGPWTSGYIAMRALGWPDAFLDSDLIVRRALRDQQPPASPNRSDAWRPWRAYAVMHLWSNSR